MNAYAPKKEIRQRKSDNPLPIQKNGYRKAARYIWIFFLSVVLVIPLYVYTVSKDPFGLFGGMPGYAAIENPENDLSTELISADGVSLGRYFLHNRSQITFDQLSSNLVNTLLLSEDHRFYNHAGMDFWAYPRVAWGIITFNSAGGGSTITQQLAKNLYTINPALDGHLAKLGELPRRIIQKTKEWIISIHLEKNFTKEEIITMYLNTSNFGSNAYGIKVATETYFNKQPGDLSIQESAVLVGMLQNPSYYNPHRHPERSLGKRNQVLYKLYKHRFINREAYDSLKSLPIDLKFLVQNQNEGLATYFRTVITQRLLDWCKENGYNLYESGLKVYTTIDSRMQQAAERSMKEHMTVLQDQFETQWEQKHSEPWVDAGGYEIRDFLQRKIKRTEAYKSLVKTYGDNTDSIHLMLNVKKPMKVFSWKGDRDTLFSSYDSLRYYNRFLQSGLMSMDPGTGAIKAWVGGIDHKFFKYDHVKQATRQPGSTFKPFVYGKAIEEGYSPCYQLYDVSPVIEIPGSLSWHPENAEGGFGSGELYNLREALALSKNSISAQLIDLVKPENVVEFAQRLGISTKLDAVPSLSLGTSDVSLYDMVAAYCSFVNLGIYTEPFFITRIEDKYGNAVATFVPKTRQVMDERTAYKMVYMLRGGVELEGGTSQGISDSLKTENEIGGKTGTTDNASDGWYVGVTPNLVTGVWVGGDERNIHFPSWHFGAGGKTARPIWEKFMISVYEDPQTGYGKGSFRRPTTPLDMTVDCSRHVLSEKDFN